MEDILLTKKKKFSFFFLSVCLSCRNFWLNVSLWRWRRFWTFSLALVSRDIHTVHTSIVSCLYTTRSPKSLWTFDSIERFASVTCSSSSSLAKPNGTYLSLSTWLVDQYLLSHCLSSRNWWKMNKIQSSSSFYPHRMGWPSSSTCYSEILLVFPSGVNWIPVIWHTSWSTSSRARPLLSHFFIPPFTTFSSFLLDMGKEAVTSDGQVIT